MADLFIGDAAFAVAIGFLTGILAENFGWSLLVVSVAFMAVGLFAYIVFLNRSIFYYFIFSFSAVFIGAYYFYFFTILRSAAVRLPSAGDGAFSAIVSDEPAASGKYLSFSAELQPPFSGTISVFAPDGSDVRYGDLLNISGTIAPPRTTSELPAVFPKRISAISRGNGSWLEEKLLNFKETIGKKFGEFLPPDEAVLLGGMTLGGTAGMSAGLKSDMTSSETLYVTSMYGYKIAMIVACIEVLLAGFVPRRARFCIAILAIALYIMMSGGNVSAMRGGVMACLVIFAKETGSVFSKRNALALAAAGMAVVHPTIVSQAGFLFSFASVAGMAFLEGPVRRFLRLGEGKGIGGWKEAVVVSVASLVPIIPLVSAMFGSFSLTAVFANILIAPIIPLGMATGVALAAAGFFSRYIAFFVAPAAGVILGYALWVIRFFAAHVIPLPFSFSGILPFLFYYAAVGLFIYAYGEHGTA